MEESDNPDFREFQDMITRDGNWMENAKEFVEDRMENNEELSGEKDEIYESKFRHK